MTDRRFSETVLYIVAHDSDGAFGLVVNRVYGEGSIGSLLDAFELAPDVSAETLRLHYGGPVQPQRGFVLHSSDYQGDSTISLNSWLSLSTGRDVLEAIANDSGPSRRLMILGYAGWGPGQLDSELASGGWLLAPANSTLIFADEPEKTWERALEQAGLPL